MILRSVLKRSEGCEIYVPASDSLVIPTSWRSI